MNAEYNELKNVKRMSVIMLAASVAFVLLCALLDYKLYTFLYDSSISAVYWTLQRNLACLLLPTFF